MIREVLATLQFGGAFAGVLIAVSVYLVARRGDHNNYLLAALLAMISVVLLRTGAQISGLTAANPHLVGVFFPLSYTLGPLLLLYVSQELENGRFSRKRLLLHMTPVALSVLMLLPVYALPAAEKKLWTDMIHQAGTLQRAIEHYSLPVSVNLGQLFTMWGMMAIYGAAAWMICLRVRASGPGDGIIRWSAILSGGLFSVGLLAFLSMTAAAALGLPLVSPILMAAYTALIIITAVSAVQLVIRPELLRRKQRQFTAEKKYARSGLGPDLAKRLQERVHELMRDQRLYRENDLSHRSLAERAGCSTKHLSHLLNEHIGMNFFDYVNGFRVNEAKTLLLDPGGTATPIVEIAFAVGFNNKPSFYSAFKKDTGLTPAQFRRQMQTPAPHAALGAEI